MFSLGSAGPQVRELQTLLNAIFAAQPTLGESAIAPMAVDGIYGQLTAARGRDFQLMQNLSIDGVNAWD